jgi:hypothetical protein
MAMVVSHFDVPFENRWHALRLVGDIATCITLLGIAAVAIEWVTRRMKRGAP